MLTVKNLLFYSFIILMVVTITGCEHLEHKKGNGDTTNLPPGAHGRMPPQVADALGFNNSKSDVVISVNNKGEVKAFVRDGVQLTERTLPIHAGDLEKIESIVVYRTSNPKVCFIFGGTQFCYDLPNI